MKKTQLFWGFCYTVTILLALSTIVEAQQTSDASSQLVLEEVIVSAQKREQSLKDVPISIGVMGGEQIDALNIINFADMATMTPNLVVKETPGNNAIYVRGIGTSPGTLSLEQSVSLFVDGVYGGRARQFQEPFLDIERVEIMFGPQGGVVGKNTSAGAVNIITRKPTDETEFSVRGAYEWELGSYDITAIASGPMSDRFAARLAVKYSDIGGWVENPGPAYGGDDYPKEENLSMRLTGVLQANDAVQITGKIGMSSFDQLGNSYETLGLDQPNGSDDLDHSNASDTIAGGLDQDNTDSTNATLTVDWGLANDFHFTSITAYSDYSMDKLVDGDFTGAPIFGARFFEEFDQFSQEFRFLSPTGQQFEYVIGAYYHQYELDLTRETKFNLGPFTGESSRRFVQDDDLYSVFGQGTWHFSDTWRLNATLRYTDESKDASLRRTVIPRVPPTQLTSPIDDSRSESQFDPAVSVQWDVKPSTTLYAAYTEGSKGGGFEGESATTTPATFQFDDEQSTSYEIGSKSNFGAASFNIALYYTQFDDLQVSTLESTPTGFQTVISNAASAITKGVEASGAWAATEEFTLTGAIAYNDAEYDSFPNGPCVYPNNAPSCFADISGTPLPHAPKWSGNLGFQYRNTLGELLLSIDGLIAYKSEHYLSDDLDPRCEQDSFSKFDLRAGIGSKDGLWEVALRGRNLTDEWTAIHCFGTPVLSASGFRTYYTAPPRTLALEVLFRF